MLQEPTNDLPPGVPLLRALRWLDDELRARPAARRAAMVNEASIRFDLTPAEEEALLVVWAKAR
jgi:hypothetical protein